MLLRLVMLWDERRLMLMLVPLLRARLREQIQVLRCVESRYEVPATHTHVEEIELGTGAETILRLMPQGQVVYARYTRWVGNCKRCRTIAMLLMAVKIKSFE